MNNKNINQNEEFMFAFDNEESLFTTSHVAPQHFTNSTVRNYADILVAHSTLPGYVSFRDRKTGSWYIQLLCSIFMQHAHEFHIQDLFLMVRKVCSLKNFPSFLVHLYIK